MSGTLLYIAWPPSYPNLFIGKDLRLIPTKEASIAIRIILIGQGFTIFNKDQSCMPWVSNISARRINYYLLTCITITGDWKAMLVKSLS